MVVHAATIKQRRGERSRRRWQIGIFLFVAVNAFAHTLGHLWLALCVTSVMMVWMFGFSNTAEEEENEFVSGRSGKGSRLSAYSVFNSGFKELPGTLNAAGIDKELRGGAGGMNSEKGSVHRWGKGHKLG